MNLIRLSTIALFLFLLLSNSSFGIDSLRYKLGQMIAVGIQSTSLNSDEIADLQDKNITGILTYGYNLSNPAQIKSLTDEIKQYAKTPPFLFIDQEGGRVARLNSTNGFGPSFSAAILGYFNEEDTTRRGTAMMADWLSDMGFNVNFAPVVDLEINTGGVIGGLDRSFSRDPQIVTNHAYWFIDEFHKKNIATCLKHFPGHGSAENDSHLGFTDITDTWLHEELEPYENLLDSGSVDMIMTGHLYHAGMDSLHPATLSYNVITDSLRNRLGYDGVVVTDEIFMNAISDNYGFVEASILAINAGVDIILSSPSVLPNDTIHHRRIADVFIDSMEQAVLTGIIPESRIEESYRRIMDLKYRWGLMDIEEEHIVDIPLHFTLEQNYPNPFNPATTIEYNVAEASLIRVDIYNALGEHVETMVNKEHSPGKYQISWNAGSYASGLYVYSLTAVTPAKGTITKLSKKMLLVK